MKLTRREALAGGVAASALLGLGASPVMAQGAAAPAAVSPQAPGFYRYRIGAIEVTAINDGYAERGVEGYVKNAPISEVEQVMRQLRQPSGKVRVPYTSLVLRTGGKTVLIDAGNGDSGAATTGTWMANFRAAGFDPATVDVVILSHFHGDHINGLRLKSGEWRFPRAEVKVPSAEWNFWMDDNRMAGVPEGARGAFQNVRRVFAPVAGAVVKFAADAEVVPGVTAVAAYGHTPGHTVFAITSGSDKLMLMSDLTNHASVFLRNPDWHVLFDMNPEEAAKTRRRMADLAVSEGMQVAFYHAPFPATGYIERAGNGYRLEPVQWS
jgi:glyoxylase-like metal-dependent hydrolase (beta-lactamase superfamily II)